MEYIVGSPEWFYETSKSQYLKEFRQRTEELRKQFNARFAPEVLRLMHGKELLEKVFGNGEAMINLLMFDPTYRRFGASGEYKYLGILYYSDGDGSWRYNENNHAESISEKEAEIKAERLRDELLECISIIEDMELNSLNDYEMLDDALSHIPFSKYAWVLKYYQMIFPQYFPGMYADNTIDRALSILGLPSHGKKKRIVNAGELSLFIRRCDVNNIVFGHIYGGFWGWEDDASACPSASHNYENRTKVPSKINLDYYELPGSDSNYLSENNSFIEDVKNSIEVLPLEGKDKQALIKVRVNQGIFRKRLLNRYGKCCLCGVSDEAFLVASHIKPWSECEADEKLDPDNGFLLCPNHDLLFDQGYISFKDDGTIMIADSMKALDRTFMNVRDDMRIDLNESNKKYLDYHRKHVFKGTDKL